MTNILLVGVGGFIGSVLRYLTGGLIYKFIDTPYVPYGTLAVNFIGCLLIGFLGGLNENHDLMNPNISLLVFVGILGGYTTFSTFGYESFLLLQDDQFVRAAVNIIANVTLSMLGVLIGFLLHKGI